MIEFFASLKKNRTRLVSFSKLSKGNSRAAIAGKVLLLNKVQNQRFAAAFSGSELHPNCKSVEFTN
jgi:hypothetical protein